MGKKRRKRRKTRQQKEEEETYDIDSVGQRNEVKEEEQEDRGDCYEINHQHPGIAVILNHEHYDNNYARRRRGTQKDYKSLNKSLEKLGFEVFPYNDLTHKEIKDVLEKVAKENHSNGDCLVVAVMTHGHGGGYVCARDEKYKTSELWEIFKGGTFKGKPKLFFIQACRNSEELNPINSVPNARDFLVMYSTSEGCYSYRNRVRGTAFIQELCNELDENASRKELAEILTAVIRRVKERGGGKELPEFSSTLTGLIFFNS